MGAEFGISVSDGFNLFFFCMGLSFPISQCLFKWVETTSYDFNTTKIHRRTTGLSLLAALLVAPFLVGDNPQAAFARERWMLCFFFCFIMRLVFLVPLIRKALNIELLFLTIVLKVVVVRIQSYAAESELVPFSLHVLREAKEATFKKIKRPRIDVAKWVHVFFGFITLACDCES